MSHALEAVTAQALKLSAAERAELIERLADSVLPPSPLHPQWEAEIARRLAELDAGLVASIPAEQVMADVRAMIENHAKR